jgi:hypothetical protein
MKGKRKIPLGLDMPFGEALARFIGADPKEAQELAQKKRRPKPPPGIVEEPSEDGG